MFEVSTQQMKNIIQKQKFDSQIKEMSELRDRLQEFKQRLKGIETPPYKISKNSEDVDEFLTDNYLETEKAKVKNKDTALVIQLMQPYVETPEHSNVIGALSALLLAKNEEIFNLRSQLDSKNKTIRKMKNDPLLPVSRNIKCNVT